MKASSGVAWASALGAVGLIAGSLMLTADLSTSATAGQPAVRPSLGSMAGEDEEALEEDYRITVEPLSIPAQAALSTGRALERNADEAVQTARDNFGMAKNSSATVALQQFTDTEYGDEQAPDDTSPSQVEPVYRDVPAYVVTFDNVTFPMFLPNTDVTDDPQTAQGASYLCDLVVFIDANTGDFIEAVTIDP